MGRLVNDHLNAAIPRNTVVPGKLLYCFVSLTLFFLDLSQPFKLYLMTACSLPVSNFLILVLSAQIKSPSAITPYNTSTQGMRPIEARMVNRMIIDIPTVIVAMEAIPTVKKTSAPRPTMIGNDQPQVPIASNSWHGSRTASQTQASVFVAYGQKDGIVMSDYCARSSKYMDKMISCKCLRSQNSCDTLQSVHDGCEQASSKPCSTHGICPACAPAFHFSNIFARLELQQLINQKGWTPKI